MAVILPKMADKTAMVDGRPQGAMEQAIDLYGFFIKLPVAQIL